MRRAAASPNLVLDGSWLDLHHAQPDHATVQAPPRAAGAPCPCSTAAGRDGARAPPQSILDAATPPCPRPAAAIGAAAPAPSVSAPPRPGPAAPLPPPVSAPQRFLAPALVAPPTPPPPAARGALMDPPPPLLLQAATLRLEIG